MCPGREREKMEEQRSASELVNEEGPGGKQGAYVSRERGR